MEISLINHPFSFSHLLKYYMFSQLGYVHTRLRTVRANAYMSFYNIMQALYLISQDKMYDT